jgi:outer membrane lipopolysaccharide assembly protein LptE/RlpB
MPLIHRRSHLSSNPRHLLALVLVFVLATLVGGCAYSLRQGKLRPGIESVAVPYLVNRSNEPDIEVELTDAILTGLIDDRTLRVTEENRADVLVVGVVRRYSFQEAFFGADRQAEEYRIDIEIEVELRRRDDDEIVAGPKIMRGTGSYYIAEGPTGEEAARAEAAQMIVEGILNLVIEEW